MKKKWAITLATLGVAFIVVMKLPRPESHFRNKPLRYWIRATVHQDKKARAEAAEVLSGLGPEAVPSLAAAVRTKNSPLVLQLRTLGSRLYLTEPPTYDAALIRGTALYVLARMGPFAEPALPEMIAALEDDELDVRMKAIRALSKVGPQALPPLMEALAHPLEVVRLGAVRALGQIGPPAKPAVTSLAGLLRERSPALRLAICTALSDIGPNASEALRALVPLLRDKQEQIRMAALRTMGQIAPKAKLTAAVMLEKLRDRDASVRNRAVYYLGQAGLVTEAVLPALLGALQDPDPDVRSRAVEALAEIGPQTAPALIDLLVREDARARQALKALGRMGTKANEAVPTLEKLKNHPDVAVRQEAILALRRIQPEAGDSNLSQ